MAECSDKRYRDKLKLLELRACPYSLTKEDLLDDVTTWPPVSWPDVHEYLVNSVGQFTNEKLKAYKSLEAFKYFTDGWLQTVWTVASTRKSRVKVFVCNCMPSQRTTDKAHRVWLGIRNDGAIVAAHCTCMAGLDEVCSHIAATLFKLEAAQRLGLSDPACTSQACTWNQNFTKKVQPAPVREIDFRRPKRLKSSVPETTTIGHRINSAPPSVFPSNIHSLFVSIVEAGLKPVVLTTMLPYSEAFEVPRKTVVGNKLPPTLTSMLKSELKSCSGEVLLSECEKAMSDMKSQYSKPALVLLESSTRLQRDSLVWYQHRAGRITASNFHSASRTNYLKPARSVMRSVFQSSPETSVCSVQQQWGITHESAARQMYANLYADQHDNHSVRDSGLWVSLQYPYVGATPDGIITDVCCGDGVLEVKCPYSVRNEMPDAAPYLLRDETGDLVLDCTHEYYTQVQGQMLVCDVSFCDFVVWTERGLAVVRVRFDAEFIRDLIVKLERLFKCSILPRLLTGEERSVQYT